MDFQVSAQKNRSQWLVKSVWPALELGIFLVLIITISWAFPASRSLKKEVSRLQTQLTEKAFLEMRHFFEFQKEHLVHLSYSLNGTGDVQKEGDTLSRFLGHQIQEIVLLDESGKERTKVTTEGVILSDLKDHSQTKGFLRAKQGDFFLGDIFLENETSFIEMAIPLRLEGGEIQGVLTAKIRLTSLWNSLSEIKLGETGIIYLVDKNGRLIFHPQLAQVLKKEVNLLGRNPVRAVIQEGRRVKGLSRDDFYINEKGLRVHATGMLFPELSWGILFEQATKESYKAKNQLLIIAGILLGVGLALSYLLSRLVLAISATFQALQKAKMAIEEEKLGLEIRVQARTKELQELAESLEYKVKDRTKELQQRVDELERFHQLTVGRELKMIELKKALREAEEKSKNLKT